MTEPRSTSPLSPRQLARAPGPRNCSIPRWDDRGAQARGRDRGGASGRAGRPDDASDLPRAAQIPGLVEAWNVALHVGLLACEDGDACAGPAFGSYSIVEAALALLAEQPRAENELSDAVRDVVRGELAGQPTFLRASVGGDPTAQAIELLEK